MHIAPWLAPLIVQAEQRSRGNWEPLTAPQYAAIGRVIDADHRGLLTRDDILDRLHTLGRQAVTP